MNIECGVLEVTIYEEELRLRDLKRMPKKLFLRYEEGKFRNVIVIFDKQQKM